MCTSFERQSALFALAVADVLLINMWAKDIGRESGSGKPLLKTIFQVTSCTRSATHKPELSFKMMTTQAGMQMHLSSGNPSDHHTPIVLLLLLVR